LSGADAPASAMAFALNNTGRIVGEGTWIFGGTRAFVTDTNGSAPSPLQTFGGETGEAYGINDAGQIVGDVEQSNGSQHPFLFDGVSMFDLGTLGGVDATVFFINELGDIAGSADTASGEAHAFIWRHGRWVGGFESAHRPRPRLGAERSARHNGGRHRRRQRHGGRQAARVSARATQRAGRAPPTVLAALSTNFIGASFPAALYLDAKAWDDVTMEVSTLNGAAFPRHRPERTDRQLVARQPRACAKRHVLRGAVPSARARRLLGMARTTALTPSRWSRTASATSRAISCRAASWARSRWRLTPRRGFTPALCRRKLR